MDADAVEVEITFLSSSTPDETPQLSHKETERFDNIDDARDFIDTQLWQIDDIFQAGERTHDGRKEYGYWSQVKDRYTGKQWYQRAIVSVKLLNTETLEVDELRPDA